MPINARQIGKQCYLHYVKKIIINKGKKSLISYKITIIFNHPCNKPY